MPVNNRLYNQVAIQKNDATSIYKPEFIRTFKLPVHQNSKLTTSDRNDFEPLKNSNVSYLDDRKKLKPIQATYDKNPNIPFYGDTQIMDYSNYSHFNSAFRNAKLDGNKQFLFKGKRFSTNLISKEESNAYLEGKKFVNDLLNKQLEEEKQDSINKRIVLSNNEVYDGTGYLGQERRNGLRESLISLNKPSYFSITNQKGKMNADGYWSPEANSLYILSKKDNHDMNVSTSVEENSHKADNFSIVNDTKYNKSFDFDELKKEIKKYPYSYSQIKNQVDLDYLSDNSERYAKMNAAAKYIIDKDIKLNDDSKMFDLRYASKDSNVPYNISQILQLYSGRNNENIALQLLNERIKYFNK